MANTAELQVLQKILGLVAERSPADPPNDVAFVCIDCEAFELDQNKITEIGVSVLHTRHLRGVPPGEGAVDWLSKIKHAHYRIKEHSHLINKRYVRGNPEGFAFGQTMWISRSIARRIMNQIFYDPCDLSMSDTPRSTLPESPTQVILTGHALRGDCTYLQKVGFSVHDLPNVVRRMDTATITGTKKQSIALGELLGVLGIVPSGSLHNAGNDAAYTLHALILMAVQEHGEPGKLSAVLAERRAEKISMREAKRETKRETKRKRETDHDTKPTSLTMSDQ